VLVDEGGGEVVRGFADEVAREGADGAGVGFGVYEVDAGGLGLVRVGGTKTARGNGGEIGGLRGCLSHSCGDLADDVGELGDGLGGGRVPDDDPGAGAVGVGDVVDGEVGELEAVHGDAAGDDLGDLVVGPLRERVGVGRQVGHVGLVAGVALV